MTRRWRKTDSNPQSPLKKDPPRRDVRPFEHFPSERDRGFESVFLHQRVRERSVPLDELSGYNALRCRTKGLDQSAANSLPQNLHTCAVAMIARGSKGASSPTEKVGVRRL